MLFRPADGGKTRLSKGQKRIAQYVEDHYDKAAFMTAQKLGDAVGVSESTVVRFALAMGFSGYPALQKALREMVRNRLTAVQRIEIAQEVAEKDVPRKVLTSDMRNIRQTLEDMDEVVFSTVLDALCAAQKIYVLGVRSSAPLAEFLGYYLSFLFEDVHIVTPGIGEIIEPIARAKPGDLLLAISFPRYSRRTLQAMRYAHEHGAATIAITDIPSSPLAQIADHALCAKGTMASFADSLVAPMSILNALIVALSLRKREQVSEHLARMESLWEMDGVYSKADE